MAAGTTTRPAWMRHSASPERPAIRPQWVLDPVIGYRKVSIGEREITKLKAAREHLHLRSATEAQRPSPLNQLDAAIAALVPAQRNRSPRLRECPFFPFLRKHGLSPRQNGAGFHNQRIFLCFHHAGFRHASAHETDLSVNSIHWFSDQRAHPCLHINYAASQWAATIDSSQRSTSGQQEC